MRVTIEELSRLLDNEIPDAERRDIENRLAACPTSQALKEAILTLSQAFVEALFTSPLPKSPPGEDCLDEEKIALLIDGELADREKTAAEEHLGRCAFCLQSVAQHLRVARRLQAGGWPALPPQVEVEIAQAPILVRVQAPSPRETWQALQIVLSRQTAVSRTLSAKTFAVSFALNRLDDEQASLTLEVREKQRPCHGQSVIAIHRQSRRKYFSGTTDTYGRLEIARLPSGVYDIHFAAHGLKVEISVVK